MPFYSLIRRKSSFGMQRLTFFLEKMFQKRGSVSQMLRERYLEFGGVESEMLPDIQSLDDQLIAIKLDAQALVSGLTEEQGGWRAAANSWSVAECFDHLAITNRVYLSAMNDAAHRARLGGKLRRDPAVPGIVGRWFVNRMEPSTKPRSGMKAPRIICPRNAPQLSDAIGNFHVSHFEVRFFLSSFAQIDLAGVYFANPFIPGVRFSLATGLHVILAHERRHLCQAWRTRRGAVEAVRARVEIARLFNTGTSRRMLA